MSTDLTAEMLKVLATNTKYLADNLTFSGFKERRSKEQIAESQRQELERLRAELPIAGKRVAAVEGDPEDVIIVFEDGSSISFGSAQSSLAFDYREAK